MTPAGNKPVQEWFTSLPDEEAKDNARDTFGHLQHLGNHLWGRPEFDQLDDGISEVRFDGKAGTYRFYGYFGPKGERQSYTLLNAQLKKKKRDPDAQSLATKRRNQIERREAGIHEFEFNERINTAPEERAGSSGEVRKFSTGQVYRFPNPSSPGPEEDESS